MTTMRGMERDDRGVFTWRHGPGGGEARCVILASGVFPSQSHEGRFDHPGPAFNRLFCFVRGSAEVAMGRRLHVLAAGRSWLLPAGRSFRVRYPAGTHFHYFHLRWLDPFGQDTFAGYSEPDGRDLGQLDGLLRVAHGPEGGGERALWQPLLIAALVRHLPERTPPPRRSERHRDLIDHVLRHAGNRLSVAALARRQALSPAALSKRFRRDTGMGLKRWLLLTAMERARELLGDGELPVQVVAERLGYADPFHFQRVFKRCVGVTPTAFRRALHGGA
jgi:AraC-like DNA-binding protein